MICYVCLGVRWSHGAECCCRARDVTPHACLRGRSDAPAAAAPVPPAQLYLTIDVQDVKNPKTDLENVDGVGKLTFAGKAGSEGTDYNLDLEFNKAIDVENSKASLFGGTNSPCVREGPRHTRPARSPMGPLSMYANMLLE